MTRLTDAEIAAGLPEGWTHEGDEIVRTYAFDAYAHGALFTAAVALLADRADHHPDLLLTYRKVTVHLSTHDAGGLTSLDLGLAREIENVFSRR